MARLHLLQIETLESAECYYAISVDLMYVLQAMTQV